MAIFCMTGGGTGGHVIPALAVARELRSRGHEVFFVGTERGVENRLVPPEGFAMDYVKLGGLKNVGAPTRIASVWGLLRGTLAQFIRFGSKRPAAVFSMGGYVAGPPVLAAIARRIPLVVMEPNAVPGFTNRHIGRWVSRALVTFEETKRYFPSGRTEVTGLPVREEFFALPPRPEGRTFTVLVTGGSQGSRTLNRASLESWKLFREAGTPLRIVHQSGPAMFDELSAAWTKAGLDGEVSPFIRDMPSAFAAADLIICRSGAGAASEVAAAGKPSILIPFPFAADQHQLKNAQAFENAGAARLVLDKDWDGAKMFAMVTELMRDPELSHAMAKAAKRLAKPGAARRAADVLETIAMA